MLTLTESARWRTMELEFLLHVRPLMFDHLESLDTLYARLDAIARRPTQANSRAAHDAVQDRLAANRVIAEAKGWTSCALERSDGMGRLRVWGVPPSGEQREVVPDWLPGER